MTRREFGQQVVNLSALSLLPWSALCNGTEAHHAAKWSPISVVLPRAFVPPDATLHKDFPFKLSRATLELLEQGFRGQNIPIWNRRFEEVDFQKRIDNIVFWVMRAVQEVRDIYPVDPVWMMAQIMHESYFYEFAISSSLAVGICQFVSNTAREYEMLCAGDREEHGAPPFARPEFAFREKEYFALRQRRRDYFRENKPEQALALEEVLQAIVQGRAFELVDVAERYLLFNEELAAIDEAMNQARSDYIRYLQANLEGRDIFDEADLAFLLRFDERVTYKKPVLGMARLLARCLRARKGNLLAAAAAYNAGLSTTMAEGIYEPYGKIPNFEQTVTYISRIFILHHEINCRLG